MEVVEGEVLEEDMVADDVSDVGGGGRAADEVGRSEEGIGDGEESKGGALVEIGRDGGGGEEIGEVGEIWVRG